MPVPTAQAEPYVSALGVHAAVVFLMKYGGTNVYIRTKNFAGAGYINITGEQGARALAEIVDRLPKRVPSQKAWLADVLNWQGLSVTQIARELHVSDTSVRKMLKTRKKHAAKVNRPWRT